MSKAVDMSTGNRHCVRSGNGLAHEKRAGSPGPEDGMPERSDATARRQGAGSTSGRRRTPWRPTVYATVVRARAPPRTGRVRSESTAELLPRYRRERIAACDRAVDRRIAEHQRDFDHGSDARVIEEGTRPAVLPHGRRSGGCVPPRRDRTARRTTGGHGHRGVDWRRSGAPESGIAIRRRGCVVSLAMSRITCGPCPPRDTRLCAPRSWTPATRSPPTRTTHPSSR